MQRYLPPLTSLKTFEAAARHMSFTKAAAELSVTQAAISHQIKVIEEFLGATLFIRQPRKLELTETGKKLLPVLQNALNSISSTVAEIRKDKEFEPLRIAVAPSFAVHWLVPRLEPFLQDHPELELSLKHSNHAVDFSNEEIDIAISYGQNKWPGLQSQRVLEIDFFPVCAPSLIKGPQALATIEDLNNFKLLHDADHKTWTQWLTLAGGDSVNPKRGTIMDDTNLLIKAAVDGLGVAMCSDYFVKDLIDSGKLVKPFDIALTAEEAYYAVCPKQYFSRKEVTTFWSWLGQQASS